MRCPRCHRRLAASGTCPVDGLRVTEPVPSSELGGTPAPCPPGYTLGPLLGAGGAGQVFAARREPEGREVALKLGRLGTRERFLREAEALRRLAPPDVPALFDAGEVEGRPFLAMERLDGETLATWMARLPTSGAAPWREAVGQALALAQVLSRVHAAGLIHRDLKPENVFLRATGAVALLDFGLARAREGQEALALTTAGQRLGTVHYMAPEQCQDAHQVDARADVYALGVILFELLTGRPPFVGEAAEVAQGHLALRPPRPSSLAAVPIEVETRVLRCLAKEPRARFEDGAALAQALEEVLAQSTALPTASPAPEPSTPRSSEPSAASTRRVILLGVGLRAPANAVLGRVTPEGGALGRLQGERCLVSFHEHPSPVAGLRAAARAARGLLSAGLIHQAVLHIAELRVRPGRTGTRLAGAALEKPEAWWVDTPEPAVALTPEAAALLAPHEVVSLAPGRFALAEQLPLAAEAETRADRLPLVGREALLAELVATARQALAESLPCLTLLEAEGGMGRTRLLAAISEALTQEGVHVLSLQAPAPDAAQEPLSVQLGRALDSCEAALPASVPEGSDAAARLSARLRERARTRPLALLVDDAHQADQLCLDALERATLSGARLPLWVCLAARPELRTLRPHLGDRAARYTGTVLPPLPGPAARSLLRELLRPVEFVPEPALAHLESLAQGNPLALVELARTLRETGAVRPDPRTGAWLLAPDELPREALATPFERVVQRTRDTLPRLSRLFASLCAVLGDSLSAEEAEAAQRHLETGDETLRELATLDAGAGLVRLARAGVLKAASEGRFTFRHRMLRDAFETDTPAPLRRALHRAALRALTAATGATHAGPQAPAHLSRRVAEHAAACGEHFLAAQAFLALGEQHRANHRDVEAEQAYSAVLAQLPENEQHLRERALGGRGRVRGRTQRFREAIEDLTAARLLAEARDDDATVVELLLEEATLNDWLERAEASRYAAEQAFLREGRLEDARLRLRCALARGRHHARDGQWPEAVEVLGAVAADAERLGDWDSEAISRVVLGVSLSFLGKLPEAASCFEELIARSRARGDLLHLASAHNSRVLLWLRQQSVEPALGDLQRTVELARELGHAQLERIASFNLAEVLHWLDRAAEALPYARRAHALGERFFGDAPMPLEAVLVARIAAARAEPSLARESLAWVERHVSPERLGPVTRVQKRLVHQLLAQASRPARPEDLDTWQELLDEAAPHASDDELLELLLHALTTALAVGQPSRARTWWQEARTRLAGAPHWSPRLAPLENRFG